MRQFLLGLSISIAFILGCVTAQHVPTMAVPRASASTPTSGYSGQRWEYLCHEGPDMKVADTANAEIMTDYLEQFGADGWEIAPMYGQGHWYCFKRAH